MQHLIAEQGAQLWQYISESNAHVYVCGATAMGSDVLKAFTEQVRTGVRVEDVSALISWPAR